MSTIQNLEHHEYDDSKGTIRKAAQYVREQRRNLGHLRDGSNRHNVVQGAISRAETVIFRAANAVPDVTHYHRPIALPAQMPQQRGCATIFAGLQ